MFKEVTLSNWRNFQSLSIELDEGVNIITGNIGCGKTNVLRGIAEISRILTDNRIVRTKYNEFEHPLEYDNDHTSEISYILHPIQGCGIIGYELRRESNNIVDEKLDLRYSDVNDYYDVLISKDDKNNKSILPRCKTLNMNIKSNISLARYIKHNTISSEYPFDIALDKFYDAVNGVYYTDLSDDYLNEAVEFIGKNNIIDVFDDFLKRFNIKLNIVINYDHIREDILIKLNNNLIGFKTISSYGIRRLAILFRLLYRDFINLKNKSKDIKYTTLLIDNFDLGLNRMIVEKLIQFFIELDIQVVLAVSDANLGLSYMKKRPNMIYIGD